MIRWNRIGVGHLLNRYLPRTETFIYRYLVAAERTKPFVYAKRFEHLEEFPINNRQPWEKGLGRSPTPTPFWRRRPCDAIRVLHAHFGNIGHQALEDARFVKLPLITSFYGWDACQLGRQEEWREKFRELFDCGSVFLVEGPAMRSRLIEFGCPPEKLRLQRIAIDLDQLPFVERTPEPDGAIRILFVARMVEKKGVLDAIEAFAGVAGRHRMARLTLIGDGPLLANARDWARKCELNGRVEFRGSVPYETVRLELERSHVFLAPSRRAENGDGEGGAPTILLEAQASGMPIVSTRHDDIPYVVREGRSALLAEEGDVDALAGHLDQLLSKPSSWAEMGRIGRQHVTAQHDVKREIRTLEQIYLDISAGHLSPLEGLP